MEFSVKCYFRVQSPLLFKNSFIIFINHGVILSITTDHFGHKCHQLFNFFNSSKIIYILWIKLSSKYAHFLKNDLGMTQDKHFKLKSVFYYKFNANSNL